MVGSKGKTRVLICKTGRILKHLAAMGVIKEAGPDTYQPTNFAKTLTIQKYSDGFPCMYVATLIYFRPPCSPIRSNLS